MAKQGGGGGGGGGGDVAAAEAWWAVVAAEAEKVCARCVLTRNSNSTCHLGYFARAGVT